MNFRFPVLALIAALACAGCQTPAEEDSLADTPTPREQMEAAQRPAPPPPEAAPVAYGGTVGVRNAPYGSRLLVDGVDVGPASRYDGRRRAFPVRNGLRRIQVVAEDGRVLFTRDQVFETSTVKIYLINQFD